MVQETKSIMVLVYFTFGTFFFVVTTNYFEWSFSMPPAFAVWTFSFCCSSTRLDLRPCRAWVHQKLMGLGPSPIGPEQNPIHDHPYLEHLSLWLYQELSMLQVQQSANYCFLD